MSIADSLTGDEGNLWIMVGKNWRISPEIQGQRITTAAPIMSGAVIFSIRYLN